MRQLVWVAHSLMRFSRFSQAMWTEPSCSSKSLNWSSLTQMSGNIYPKGLRNGEFEGQTIQMMCLRPYFQPKIEW